MILIFSTLPLIIFPCDFLHSRLNSKQINRITIKSGAKWMCLVEQAFSVIAEAFVTVEYIWHTMSFCSDWLAAQRDTVSSMISQKWEMQLKCQVAASSYYDDWKEMCAVADAGAANAAELNLRRGAHTCSGGLNCVHPLLRLKLSCYSIHIKSEL